MQHAPLHIGWATADLTPSEPVIVTGQFHARVSEGVLDPITATALALESEGNGRVVLVSCDVVSIPDGLREAVREKVRQRLPEVDPACVCLNATHTHTGPDLNAQGDPLRQGPEDRTTRFGLTPEELGVMDPAAYVAQAADRIADAVVRAWKGRTPGGIGFGLGQAVVGRNRRIAFMNGESRMYAKTNAPDFSHVEGTEDHDVNLLCTYDAERRLTGMIVNVACPSQVSESAFVLSADYWHDTRTELRRRLGGDLFVLPQCGAAGDQSPHVLINQAAEARMLALKARSEEKPAPVNSNLDAPMALRREIAQRIADAVTGILPEIEKAIEFTPAFAHRRATIGLARRALTRQDVEEALAEAETFRKNYETLRTELEANPDRKKEPRWYIEITRLHSRMRWFQGVETRYQLQQENPEQPVELSLLRLGDVAIATNPFEFYTDFGIRIKARSPAVQTFVVQLAGTGTYLPTERAVAGKSYGAVPASTPIGPAGGQQVVDRTLETLAEFWA